jgi:hypothetical protein
MMEGVKKDRICVYSLLSLLSSWHSPEIITEARPLYVTVVFGMFINSYFTLVSERMCRSQCPRLLRRRSSAARRLRLWVRIPPGSRIFVCCECCVLSGSGLCDRLITRPQESYRMWCVVVCDQETSKTSRLKSATGL